MPADLAAAEAAEGTGVDVTEEPIDPLIARFVSFAEDGEVAAARPIRPSFSQDVSGL